ncbi:heat-inducible transcriptional repressor HrcA [Caenispirillum bisanense]|uniref:heat-inducible transcriptional repressor HrcA n=1 Tax=Caenispirillum bisanense TaxID=414052 RepID=UPI0031D2978C
MSTRSTRSARTTPIVELNERSREILRHVVDAYVQTGEPVGSRTLSKRLSMSLSPATIRNAMADLEDLGLLYAPHTSAGRLPTELGLRMFVSGLLEIGSLADDERARIDAQCAARGKSLPDVLSEATRTLSGLSLCAGLVLAPKTESPLKHIEFVNLGPGRALVVIVTQNGVVENRIIEVPHDLPPTALVEASNYLAARMTNRTLDEAREDILKELESHKSKLDELTSKVVSAGLGTWAGDKADGALIVRGQSHLLSDVTAIEDLERIRNLFDMLETREQMLRLLDLVGKAEGVQIFIGAENELFAATGCSMIVSPFRNGAEEIVGAIGVIGPTRINYARIIPLVDYTAKVVGRLIG